MNRRTMLTWGGAVCVAVGGAISVGALAGDEPAKIDEGAIEAVPFAEELVTTIGEYSTWHRADYSLRQALMSCTGILYAPIKKSRSDDADTHGQKLYYLFAKDLMAYQMDRNLMVKGEPAERPTSPQPIGQTLIKQTWSAEEVDYSANEWHYDPKISINHAAKAAYRACEQRELFVMMKMDPATPGTDNGWVYGVLSPDGKQVLHAGRIESCMGCHEDAPHDRLFGLK